ncbi:uncharacterized protein LOC124819096 [Hydra vulgaris]|uniref:uncharacterized protein LOC124819096 n=1 Tax=Hydra vulgaris TaxID=6087 RepID=UPI001F5FE6DA|nr:uncharacterized protein LOC124819096 [Hydra vulgaris]
MTEEERQQQQRERNEREIQQRIRNLFRPIAPPPPEAIVEDEHEDVEEDDEDDDIENKNQRNNYELNIPVVLPSIESMCLGCCLCFYPLRPRRPCCHRRCGMRGACTGCCICTFNTIEAIRAAMQEKIATKRQYWLNNPMQYQS